MIIYFFISIILKLYLFLNVLQKSYYEYKSMFLYILKKYHILFISNVSIILLLLFKYPFFHLLVLSALIIQCGFLLKKSKVFLKITKRIFRLLITIVLEIIILSFFIPYFIIDLMVPLIILLADLINKPIELGINLRFIKRAKKIADNLSSVKIAITGSYGKTSVKNYLTSVLKKRFLVNATPKSYNTPLGIAKFINNTQVKYSDFIVYEFGARRLGDIKELAKYYKYDIAIITAIGKMHIDSFNSFENIVFEKMSLLNYLNSGGFAILNYENESVRDFPVNITKYTYGFSYGSFQAKNVEVSIYGSKFDLFIDNVFIRNFVVRPLGKGAILNILPAIIICYLYELDYSFIEEVEMVENRLSLRTFDDYIILDDAYNSNILGATYALEVLNSYNGKKYIITPGFIEMDSVQEELAKEYGERISEYTDCVVLVKNNFTKLLSEFIRGKEIYFVESFKEGFSLFLSIKEKNSILLIENDLLE